MLNTNKKSWLYVFIFVFVFVWLSYDFIGTFRDGGTLQMRGAGRIFFSNSPILFIITIVTKLLVFCYSTFYLVKSCSVLLSLLTSNSGSSKNNVKQNKKKKVTNIKRKKYKKGWMSKSNNDN